MVIKYSHQSPSMPLLRCIRIMETELVLQCKHWLVKSRISITQWKHRTSTSCWHNDGASKENLHLIIKVNKLFSSFSSQCFLKEIENMFFVFLSSYIETIVKVWQNLKKAVETLACSLSVFPHHFLFSQTSTRGSITR